MRACAVCGADLNEAGPEHHHEPEDTNCACGAPMVRIGEDVSERLDVVLVLEGIEHEETLEILETSLGRIAVAICADCIVPNATSLRPALERAQPDLPVTTLTTDADLAVSA